MQRVVGQLPFTLGDPRLHAGEGLGQQPQFITTLHRRHRLIVALAHTFGHTCQLAHRLGDVTGQQQGADQRRQQSTHSNQQNVLVQRRKRLHGLVQRAVQERLHLIVARLGQGQLFGQVMLAGKVQVLQAARTGRRRAQRAHAGALLGVQGGYQRPLTALVKGNERNLQIGQLAQLTGECLVHAKAHHHPSNRQRRQHGGLDQQMRFAVQGHDQVRLAALARLQQRLAVTKRAAGGEALDTGNQHSAIQAQQQHLAGTDARAMIGQHRADGGAVVAGHRILEAEVGRQHLQGIAQLTAAGIQQAFEDPRTDAQLRHRLLLDRRPGGHLHGEVQRAHHQQQQQDQHRGDARLKAVSDLHRRPF